MIYPRHWSEGCEIYEDRADMSVNRWRKLTDRHSPPGVGRPCAGMGSCAAEWMAVPVSRLLSTREARPCLTDESVWDEMPG